MEKINRDFKNLDPEKSAKIYAEYKAPTKLVPVKAKLKSTDMLYLDKCNLNRYYVFGKDKEERGTIVGFYTTPDRVDGKNVILATDYEAKKIKEFCCEKL